MLNWLLPFDYLYSWTESIVTPKLAPVKEYRAVVIMAYAVALLASSSFLAGVGYVLHHPPLDFAWFLSIVVTSMLLSYFFLKKIYFGHDRGKRVSRQLTRQSESGKKAAFWLSYGLIHAYSLLVLNAASGAR